MERLKKIRDLEKQSHIKVYSSETLYERESWLKKPVKTVLNLLPEFEENESLYVLDLGCGVGRNCIPIAQKYSNIDCKIDGVDILDLAIKQLKDYSCKYGVDSCINGIVMPLEKYNLWRVENGKIAEHWDVMETIADKATWQNQNGKF